MRTSTMTFAGGNNSNTQKSKTDNSGTNGESEKLEPIIAASVLPV